MINTLDIRLKNNFDAKKFHIIKKIIIKLSKNVNINNKNIQTINLKLNKKV